jgi:hypothetical protein
MHQQHELKRQKIKSLVEQAGYADIPPRPLPTYVWIAAGLLAGFAVAGIAAMLM